jgi:hypothetical protein
LVFPETEQQVSPAKVGKSVPINRLDVRNLFMYKNIRLNKLSKRQLLETSASSLGYFLPLLRSRDTLFIC